MLDTWLSLKMNTSSTGQALDKCYASKDWMKLCDTSKVVICLKNNAKVMSTLGICTALLRDRSNTFILAKSSGVLEALRKSFN